MRFTDMHSGSAVCTPTRYGILNGPLLLAQFTDKRCALGILAESHRAGRLTVPAMLKKSGYYTAGVGKWHLGLGNREKTDYSKPLRPGPVDHGFDYYFGIPASLDMDPYLYFENDRAVEQPTAHTAGKNTPRGVFWREGPISPGFNIPEVLPTLADKAVSVIRERAAKPAAVLPLLRADGSAYTVGSEAAICQASHKAGLYGDFVAQVDDTLGRIVKTLEQTGVAG